MRSPGGFPEYPVPLRAALDRLSVLERRTALLEDRLARRGGSEEDWGELRGWTEERDVLRTAIGTLRDFLPTLPRCGCGKLVHESEETAERHAATLRLIDDRRERGRVTVYLCRVRREPGYHVGHTDRSGV